MSIRIAQLTFFLVFFIACGGGDSGPDPLLKKPVIFGLGISISDIPLTHPVQPRLFNEFGLPTESGEGGAKNLAHPEFYMPMGAGVFAVSNAKVKAVLELNGGSDMLILVTPDDATQWTIGYEHVSNVSVSVGDQIRTGDLLAELSPESSQFFQGFGKTTIMVFIDSNSADPNLAYCPFLLLDASVKQSIYDELTTHIQQWEANIGMDTFDEEAWFSTGCYLEMTNG